MVSACGLRLDSLRNSFSGENIRAINKNVLKCGAAEGWKKNVGTIT